MLLAVQGGRSQCEEPGPEPCSWVGLPRFAPSGRFYTGGPHEPAVWRCRQAASLSAPISRHGQLRPREPIRALNGRVDSACRAWGGQQQQHGKVYLYRTGQPFISSHSD